VRGLQALTPAVAPSGVVALSDAVPALSGEVAPLADAAAVVVAVAPSADVVAPLSDSVAPPSDAVAPLSDAMRPSGHLVHAPCSDYIRTARIKSVSLSLPRGQQTGAYAQRP
jgi:hypothetical protein